MASPILNQLPCDGNGICMVCKTAPSEDETLVCNICATSWHASCLVTLSGNLLGWECPDCTVPAPDVNVSVNAGPSGVSDSGDSNGLIALIRAIEADTALSELEKSKRRQQLLTGEADDVSDGETDNNLELFKCSLCLFTMDRPVSTTCGHNFCLSCFKKWTLQGQKVCPKCRSPVPKNMLNNPIINLVLVEVIRNAKCGRANSSVEARVVPEYIHNQDRPDTAFRSDRAKRGGNGNASSGRIMVTIPTDHFGPILAEHDPEKHRGVLVGDSWATRLDCRQWGAHFPHIAGISGQAKYGAQSVVLSGGYEDDEDHGEWFLYTGSGGRDLSGNKRVTKEQSSDQKFVKGNEALRLSCEKGHPIRVVRSYKEKRSSYAPSLEAGNLGLRYDGIYRVEKCWKKKGKQGFIVCRYLFVRCDNAPAPWASDERGDVPRDLPDVDELNEAVDLYERKEKPMWDYDKQDNCWKWTSPPPASKKRPISEEGRKGKGKRIRRIGDDVKGLSCLICKKLMVFPITTPCGHNFCKGCLETTFAEQTLLRERTSASGRSLRARKKVMKCPRCGNDIAEFLQNAQVNRELQTYIDNLPKDVAVEESPAKGKGKKMEEVYEEDEEVYEEEEDEDDKEEDEDDEEDDEDEDEEEETDNESPKD